MKTNVEILPKHKSWIEVLENSIEHYPQKRAFTYLLDGEVSNELVMTYEMLVEHSKATGAYLQKLGLQNKSALLLYPNGLEYVTGFLGCLYANVTAATAYPPEKNKNLNRLLSIVTDFKPSMILTTSQIMDEVKEAFIEQDSTLANLEWIATDQIDMKVARDWKQVEVNEDETAFIQYTSGSTSVPKGVMVSYFNLLHNQEYLIKALGTNQDSVIVTWAPLFHDMGIIAKVLHTVYCGAHCVMMSPADFVEKPFRWLNAISHYRGTITGAPNFAYDLCVSKVTEEQKSSLDLSSMVSAFNGAEPIRYGTYERFVHSFKRNGFKMEAFNSVYGLAEATLIFTAGEISEKPKKMLVNREAIKKGKVIEELIENSESQTIASCGRPMPDTDVRIVDPTTNKLSGESQVGEVWVKNPSVTKGYWKRPEVTEEIFRAYLKDTGEGPFLRTGDLGFMKDREVYITGRKKDVIIVRGKNYYPQDLEYLSENSHVAARPGCVAAFSIEEDEQTKVILVQEVKRDYNRKALVDVKGIAAAIRKSIAKEYDIKIDNVVLIKTGTIPKTSSGKIQRTGARLGYLNGVLNKWGSSSLKGSQVTKVMSDKERRRTLSLPKEQRTYAVADHLCEVFAKYLDVAPNLISLDTILKDLGIDSLMAAEFSNAVENLFGARISIARFLERLTVRQIADEVIKHSDEVIKEPDLISKLSDSYPLSHGQEAIWYIQKLEPDSSAYNLMFPLHILSKLDVSALERTLQYLLDRHSVLRTVFLEENGKVLQKINSVQKIKLKREDLTHLNDTEIREYVTEDAHRPFNLQTDSVIRFKLFELPANEHILLITAHHIAMDFWSFEVFLDELCRLYNAEMSGKSASLPVLEIKYADYADWQRNLVESIAGRKMKDFWTRELVGELPVLDLITDKKRAPIQTFNGQDYHFTINERLTDDLKSFSRQNGVTLYVTMLALYQTLLYQFSGQEEIIIGSPIANRVREKVKNMLGYITNPMAMRLSASGEMTFSEIVNRVQQKVLGALENQEIPLPALMDDLIINRDSSRSPIFQTMFVFQKAHLNNRFSPFIYGLDGEKEEFGSLHLKPYKIPKKYSQFDLELEVMDYQNEIHGSWQYNTDLFERSTIERFSRHLFHLLQQVTANPNQPISEIPKISTEEYEVIINKWNHTEVPFRNEISLHELVDEQVSRTPNEVALLDEKRTVTYSEMNIASNRLAHYLVRSGVKQGSVVAIYLERSIEMIISMLGILKAGGAYLPIEADTPSNRLQELLLDSGCLFCITKENGRQNFDENLAIIALDEESHLISREPSQSPKMNISGSDLVSVYYTSGSSGKPKGIQNLHRGWVNRMQWMQDEYALQKGETVLQKTAITFDDSAVEIFWPLISGGRVAILSPGEQRDPWAILKAINDFNVSVLHFVPSMLNAFLDALNPIDQERLKTLRLVISSGEALQSELVKKHYSKLDCPLYNQWGLTETSIDSTSYRCSADSDLEGNVPIGRPIANNQIYILDKEMQPIPVGVVGDLYISGVGMARGYLNRPEEEKASFLENPFDKGRLMYKTGDRGYYLSDGNIVFLGRLDGQIKINGVRVELAEVESTLLQHPSIQSAAVISQEHKNTKQLIAYLTLENGRDMDPAEIRTFLMKELPVYMIPSLFIKMDKLPVTVSGKLDKKVLPAADKLSGISKENIQPRNDVEEILVLIWKEVLGLDNVSITTNFFEVGGHSLLAVQMVSRIRSLFRVNLPVRQFIESPTIEELSRTLNHFESDHGHLQKAARIVKNVTEMSAEKVQMELKK